MAKWVRVDVLDSGLLYIKNNATKMLLVSTYTGGDSYATVTSNILASADMTSGDFTIASAGINRTLTVASGKTATASASSATPDLHIVFTNGTDEVIWVTDETTDQAIVSGNTINFPAPVYTSNQPV